MSHPGDFPTDVFLPFGDILSDFGPAIAGSIGIVPGGNMNAGKECPSMFEPVHGSAPDIAGRNIASPSA